MQPNRNTRGRLANDGPATCKTWCKQYNHFGSSSCVWNISRWIALGDILTRGSHEDQNKMRVISISPYPLTKYYATRECIAYITYVCHALVTWDGSTSANTSNYYQSLNNVTAVVSVKNLIALLLKFYDC